MRTNYCPQFRCAGVQSRALPEPQTRRIQKRKVLENPYLDGKTNYLYYKAPPILASPLSTVATWGDFHLHAHQLHGLLKCPQGEQNKVWTGMAKETAHRLELR